MSTSVQPTNPPPAQPAPATRRRRRLRGGSTGGRSILAYGEPVVWLTGGALVFAIIMIVSLLLLIAVLGLNTFRPVPLVEFQLRDGQTLMGEVTKQDTFEITADSLLQEAEVVQSHLLELLVNRVEDLSALPLQIQSRANGLVAEQQSLDQRLGKVVARIARLQADRNIPSSPPERANMIRHSDNAQRLQELRDRRASLQRRDESLKAELAAAKEAVAFYGDADNQSVSAMLAADYPLRVAGINGLIGLVSNQHGESAVRFRRRLVRTGNYELTNEHFDWVADFEIKEDGERQPPRATLVERTSWGRFYGTPQAFLTVDKRPITNNERECRAILDFFDAHRRLLDEAQQSSLEVELATVQEDYRRWQKAAIRAFLDHFQKNLEGEQVVQVVIDDGQTVPLQQWDGQQNVQSVRGVIQDADRAWLAFNQIHDEVRQREQHAEHLEEHALGATYAQQEDARLAVRQAELDHDVELLPLASRYLTVEQRADNLKSQLKTADACLAIVKRRYGKDQLQRLTQSVHEQLAAQLEQQIADCRQEQSQLMTQFERVSLEVAKTAQAYFAIEENAMKESARIQAEVRDTRKRNQRFRLNMVTAEGHEKDLLAGEVVRAFQPNQLSMGEAWSVYFSRWWEFLTAEPREANSEGGVMPAIWGTVVMTLLMSVAVVPFGVMAALYLREYAKAGIVVSVIRIAINNLAGVPSIVFGVFGLGFFCYIIGAYVDGGPDNAGFAPVPPARWFVGLAALVFGGLSAFITSVVSFGGPPGSRSSWKRWLGYFSICVWAASTILFFGLVFTTPFFNGFYEAKLPNPSWGKPGIVWAALTLSLMTLPVVIVATEEALAAVPNSMREGSYGCGASKWQTIRRIVLPHAMPGIMTGMILAMARGAGEVAPLMLTGAVKLAPELPLDSYFPYLHGSRSFMHLGFHVFDVGFQSQNSEAAKPMVYTTTLLLIVIITVLNLLAIGLRAFLRKRFSTGQF